MPPPGGAERRGQGGAVERPRRRSAPVEQRALPVRRVGQPDPADVAGRPVGVVEPAETQARPGGGQHRNPLRPAVHRDIALPEGAELAAGLGGEHAAGAGRGVGELGGQQGVQAAEPRGFRGQLLLEGGTVEGLRARAIIEVRSGCLLI
jgi:hypothetical protein